MSTKRTILIAVIGILTSSMAGITVYLDKTKGWNTPIDGQLLLRSYPENKGTTPSTFPDRLVGNEPVESFYGCYELKISYRSSQESLGNWTPRKRLRLMSGIPPKPSKPCFLTRPREGLWVVPLPGQTITNCLFEYSSWHLRGDNAVIVSWSTGFTGVTMWLKRDHSFLRGRIGRFTDVSAGNDSNEYYPVEARPIDCLE